MGCCGCSSKSSAVTAGIFGLIQGGIGLILNSYFLNLYSNYPYQLSPSNLDERLFLIYATRQVITELEIILVVALLLHSLWIISSILLLIGNANNKACMVRQWVVITAFIIIGDIILPVIVVLLTFGSFQDVVDSGRSKVNFNQEQSFSSSLQNTVENKIADVSLDLYKYYIIFLLSFTKFGLITIIVNICLNVFTNRRAREISNPRGYVIGTTVTIIHNQTINPGMMQVGPTQPGYPVLAQQGMPNTYYAGNIPMQTADNFGPGPSVAVPPPAYEHEAMSNPLRDDLKDPLLPPKNQHERF